MDKKYWLTALGALLVWWVAHINEGATRLQKANRTCDFIYWFGSYSKTEIAYGFTNDEKKAALWSKSMVDYFGEGCFYLSSSLLRAVNPDNDWETRNKLFNDHYRRLPESAPAIDIENKPRAKN